MVLNGKSRAASPDDLWDEVRLSCLSLTALASPTPPSHFLASTGKSGQGHDFVTLPPKSKQVVATVKEPAVLHRLWFTAEQVKQVSVHIRFRESTAVKMLTLFDGKTGKAFAPVLTLGGIWKQEFCSYLPFPVSGSAELVVTNHAAQPNKFFFQISYRTAKPPLPSLSAFLASLAQGKQLGATIREMCKVMAKWDKPKQLGYHSTDANCPPGQETQLVKLDGSGVIYSLRLKLSTKNLRALQNIWLICRWDGEKQPSVRARLSWLCGQYFALQPMRSTMASFDGKNFVLRFPMPFSKSARLSLLNLNRRTVVKVPASVTWLQLKKVPPYRFRAVSASVKTKKGKPVRLLDVRGEGNLVGLTLAVQGTFHRNFAFLEGNEQIEVDGKRLEGTGTEDFFNSAWFFPNQPASFPFHGLTHKSTPPAKVSAYRWLLIDRIPFRKRLRFDLQHGRRNNMAGITYRWTVIWYQKSMRK